MRRVALLTVCCLAVTVVSLMWADTADARRFGGRGVFAARGYSGAPARAPRYPTYFTPQNPYGPSYYNPRFYGGYYGRGFYASPSGPMYIGW
jgi:hypothetical protein